MRDLITYFPQNAYELAPTTSVFKFSKSKLTQIEKILPENISVPYDVRKLIDCIVDDTSFREVQKIC